MFCLRIFCPSGHFLYVCPDVLSPQTFGLPDVLSRWTFCPSGRFVLDFLSLRTFCSSGRFVPPYVLSLRTFCPTDVLSPTPMCLDVMSPDVMSPDVMSLDVLSFRMFCPSGRFVWAPLSLLDLKGTLT